jgi:hypothetical protein
MQKECAKEILNRRSVKAYLKKTIDKEKSTPKYDVQITKAICERENSKSLR